MDFEQANMLHVMQAYRSPSADSMNLLLIRGASNPAVAVRIYLDKQAERLNTQTRTQRHWQRLTRDLRRANHHDTVATRERYVRGFTDRYEIPDAYKGVYRGVCRIPECPYSATTEYFLCRKHRNASVNSRV